MLYKPAISASPAVSLLLSLILVTAIVFATLPQANATERPNLLFIFADDQSYETLGSLGQVDIATPNLDRLARRGITFTRAYNMGSFSPAVCIASRTMLNTGSSVWRAEALYDSAEQERQAGRWWSEYLKQAGYDTYMTGKWHLQADAKKAFDTARHVRPGMPQDGPEFYNRPLPDQPDEWKPWDKSRGGYWEGGKHWSEVVGDDGVDYLQQAAEHNKPFFMYLAFNAPHDPRQSPKAYVDKYPLDKVQVPRNFLPIYPFNYGIGCNPKLRDEALGPFPRTEHAVKVHRQEYFAIISHMDTQIGRILDALEASGKADNTMIFFTADHGLAVGHHGLFGKQNMYEHSVRVPLLVAGPGVKPAQSIDTTVYLQDIMPTTLELAGVEKPDHVEFHSLVPVIEDPEAGAYDAVYGAYLDYQRMVTLDGFKLILYPKLKQARLYHLAKDPDEMHDLADDPQSLPIMKRLFAKLRELQAQYDDPVELDERFPKLSKSI